MTKRTTNESSEIKPYELALSLLAIAALLCSICTVILGGGKIASPILFVVSLSLFMGLQMTLVALQYGLEELNVFSRVQQLKIDGCVFFFYIVPISLFYILVRVFQISVLSVIAQWRILCGYKKIAIPVLVAMVAFAVILCIGTPMINAGNDHKKASIAEQNMESMLTERLATCSGDIYFTPDMVEAVEKMGNPLVTANKVWETDYFRSFVAVRLKELLDQQDYDGIFTLLEYLLQQKIHLSSHEPNGISIVFSEADINKLTALITEKGADAGKALHTPKYAYKGLVFTPVGDTIFFETGTVGISSICSVEEWKDDEDASNRALVAGTLYSAENILDKRQTD